VRKNRGWGSKILGVFVEQTPDAATDVPSTPTTSPESTDSAFITPIPEPTPTSEPAPNPSAPATTNSLLDVDIGTLYERGGVVGDPNTDPLLDAFDSMTSTLDGEDLTTAMEAMIRAVRADRHSVAKTLEERARLLDIAAAQQKQSVEEGVRRRMAELETMRQSTSTEIAELEQRIRSLKETLDTREQDARREDAESLGSLTGFEQRITREKTRLQALRDFLISKTAPPNASRPS
jgi:hypothetical protein